MTREAEYFYEHPPHAPQPLSARAILAGLWFWVIGLAGLAALYVA